MATRFYFSSIELSGVTPTPDASWDDSVGAHSHRLMRTDKDGSSASSALTGRSWTPGNKAFCMQILSLPMEAQTISGTVKAQLQAYESNADDNIDQPYMSIRVVSEDGSSVTGTLLTLGVYGPTTELNTSKRNKTFADGDSLSELAVNDGDRLCVEIGFKDTSGTSPSVTIRTCGTGSDLGENETDTTDLCPWIEFSDNITFKQYSLPATLYLNATDVLSNILETLAESAPSSLDENAGFQAWSNSAPYHYWYNPNTENWGESSGEPPTGWPSGVGEIYGYISQKAYYGSVNGTFTLYFKVKSSGTYYDTKGKVYARVWKSKDNYADFSAQCDELSNGWAKSSEISWTGTDQYQTGTLSIPVSGTLNYEFISLELVWYCTDSGVEMNEGLVLWAHNEGDAEKLTWEESPRVPRHGFVNFQNPGIV